MAKVPVEWLRGETLGPGEVARIFNVDTRTVTKWAQGGMIGFFRTPNGMRRYPECEVHRLANGTEPPPDCVAELAEADNEKYGKMWRDGWRRSDKSPFYINLKDKG